MVEYSTWFVVDARLIMLRSEYFLSMTVVLAEQVKRLLPEFEQYYSTIETETMLENAQHAFRSFWTTKILDKSVKDLDELEDMDPMIRLFDSAGKRRYEYKTKEERDSLKEKLIHGGKQYGLTYNVRDESAKKRLVVGKPFSVARCMMTQTDWHRIIRDLKTHTELSEKLDRVLKEEDLARKASLIDELRQLNSSHKNLLTSPGAVAMNVMLFCNDPSLNHSVVSLPHRKTIVEAFELGDCPDTWSYGEQVIKSNELLKNFNEKYSTNLDPRRLSYFLYWERAQPLWKVEKPPPSPDREVTKHTEIQYILIKLGQAFGCEIWVAPNDRSKSFEGERFSDLAVNRLPSFGPKETDKTTERIDVIWLQENMVTAAFEIEASTSIYSGLLRMSDLLALVANISFPIYIVAPSERANDVKEQLLRPTFRKLKLDEKCRYISSEELEKKYEPLLELGNVESLNKIAKRANQI